MSQIGIAIKPTISGNHHPIAINEGDWTRHIRDMRPALLHYPAMQKDHKLIASMFFFDEKGCYIVICRTVTNNDLENVSGWIHIPYNMQISTAELGEVISLMRQIVEQPVLPLRQYLQQIFGAKQYPDKHDAQLFEPSPRIAIFAKRVLGRNQSLATVLGENLFLPSYANYETILVEEFPGEVTDADDITQVCNNEQTQIEAEIRRQSRVSQGRGNRRVNQQSGRNERTKVFGQDERTKVFGHGERTKPMNFPPRQHGYTDLRGGDQRPVDGYVTPPVTPVNQPYRVPEKPQNLFQKNLIGFIIGIAAGILVGILIMLPFRNNSSKEKQIPPEADTLVTVGVVEELTADSAITTTPTTETTASPSESESDAPAAPSSRHRSHRDKSRNSTSNESTGTHKTTKPIPRTNPTPKPTPTPAPKPTPTPKPNPTVEKKDPAKTPASDQKEQKKLKPVPIDR